MYDVRIEPARNLIRIAISGFWQRDKTEAFCAELRTQIATLGTGAGHHVMLCDLSAASVAPAETIAAIGDILANPGFVGLKARRLAFYTPSALLRLQMGRLTGIREGVRIFATCADAEAWLFEASAANAA